MELIAATWNEVLAGAPIRIKGLVIQALSRKHLDVGRFSAENLPKVTQYLKEKFGDNSSQVQDVTAYFERKQLT